MVILFVFPKPDILILVVKTCIVFRCNEMHASSSLILLLNFLLEIILPTSKCVLELAMYSEVFLNPFIMQVYFCNFSSVQVQDIPILVSVLNFSHLWNKFTWLFIHFNFNILDSCLICLYFYICYIVRKCFYKDMQYLVISNYLYIVLICFQVYRMIYFICDTSLIGPSNLHIIMCSSRGFNGL